MIDTSSIFLHKEPIFHYLYYLVAHYIGSYRVMMIIQSLFFLLPLTVVLIKEKVSPIESLALLYFLGFFMLSFNITRQTIAASFLLLGYHFLSRNKLFPFIFFLLVAEGFHNTSFFAIPILLLPYIKLKRYFSILLLLLSFIVPLFVDITAKIVDSPLIDVFGDVSAFGHYITQQYDVMTRIPIFPFLRTILFIYIIINTIDKDRANDLFYKISYCYVIGSNMMINVPSFIGRILLYFEIALVIYLVRWCKNGYFQTLTTYSYILLYFFYYYIILDTDGLKPYVFYV